MRQIIVAEFVSLDGVMHEPAWTFPYWNDEIAAFKEEENATSDAMLLGRVTFEGFAQVWPTRTQEDDEGTAWMNNTAKYVVSTTLPNADAWHNSHLIAANVVEEIRALKQRDGQDILVYGSGQLVQTLIQHDLVDRFRLLVYPVVLGTGQRLFAEGTTAKFELVESRAFSSGVVGLVYAPDRSASAE